MRERRFELLLASGLVGWSLLVATGWLAMLSYGYRRDERPVEIVAQWPVDTPLPRIPGQKTLLLFVHPHCSCTHATLTELEKLLALDRLLRPDRKISVCVVATIPPSADEAWGDTSIVRRGLAIAGARLFLDRGGAESDRFGAQTSGTVLLFGADARREYAGGVTISRGHEGPSFGGTTLAKIFAGERVDECTSAAPVPVFGCRLVFSPRDSAERKAVCDTSAGESTSKGLTARTVNSRVCRAPQGLSPGSSVPVDDRGD